MRKAPAVNAVERAQVAGVATEGPFPADAGFLRAKNGAFDAVLTMYHDQDQIAVKLMGFDQTLLGGFGFSDLHASTRNRLRHRRVGDRGNRSDTRQSTPHIRRQDRSIAARSRDRQPSLP